MYSIRMVVAACVFTFAALALIAIIYLQRRAEKKIRERKKPYLSLDDE